MIRDISFPTDFFFEPRYHELLPLGAKTPDFFFLKVPGRLHQGSYSGHPSLFRRSKKRYLQGSMNYLDFKS